MTKDEEIELLKKQIKAEQERNAILESRIQVFVTSYFPRPEPINATLMRPRGNGYYE